MNMLQNIFKKIYSNSRLEAESTTQSKCQQLDPTIRIQIGIFLEISSPKRKHIGCSPVRSPSQHTQSGLFLSETLPLMHNYSFPSKVPDLAHTHSSFPSKILLLIHQHHTLWSFHRQSLPSIHYWSFHNKIPPPAYTSIGVFSVRFHPQNIHLTFPSGILLLTHTHNTGLSPIRSYPKLGLYTAAIYQFGSSRLIFIIC